MGRFEFGPDHPFKPERATKTYDLCNRYGVLNYPWMQMVNPEPLDPQPSHPVSTNPSTLTFFGKPAAGRCVSKCSPAALGTQDTPIIKGIYEWSLRAAGERIAPPWRS